MVHLKKITKPEKHPIVNCHEANENFEENQNQIVISDECSLPQDATVICNCTNLKKRSEKTKENDNVSTQRCKDCKCIIPSENKEKIQEKYVNSHCVLKNKKCCHSNSNQDNIQTCCCGNARVNCEHNAEEDSKNVESTDIKCCHSHKNSKDITNNSRSGNTCINFGLKKTALSELTKKVQKEHCHTDKRSKRDTENNIQNVACESSANRTSPRFSKRDVEEIMRESLKFLRDEGVMETKVGDGNAENNERKPTESYTEVGRGDNFKAPLRKETTKKKTKRLNNISLYGATAESQSEASIQSELDSETELHRLVQKLQRHRRNDNNVKRDKQTPKDCDIEAATSTTTASRRPRKKNVKKKSSRSLFTASKATQCTDEFNTARRPCLTIVQSTKNTEIPLKSFETPSKIVLKSIKSASDHEFEIHIEFKKRIESGSVDINSSKIKKHTEDENSKFSVSSTSTAYMNLPDKIIPNGFRSDFFKLYNAYVTKVDNEKTESDVSELDLSNESDWKDYTNEENHKEITQLDYCECGVECKFCEKACSRLKKDKLRLGLESEICECEKDFFTFEKCQRYTGNDKLDLGTFGKKSLERKKREIIKNNKTNLNRGSKNASSKTNKGSKNGEVMKHYFLRDVFRDEIEIKKESRAESSSSDTASAFKLPSTSTKGLQVKSSVSEIGSGSLGINSGTVRTVDIGIQGSPLLSDTAYLGDNCRNIFKTDEIKTVKSLDDHELPTKDTDHVVQEKKKICSKAHRKFKSKNVIKRLESGKYEQENKLEKIVQGNRFTYNFNTDTSNGESKKLDPQVEMYIKKLLNISRDKIALMEVSSSTVETPSSSIIETPSNSTTNMFQEDPEKLARLNEFFKENQELVTGLLSMSKDSVLLAKYDVETQIIHSNVPILKFKSKFKPSYDLNNRGLSQTHKKDGKKVKPNVLAKSHSRNLTKHFENRQVVEKKKLLRLLTSLGSVQQDIKSRKEENRTSLQINSHRIRSSSVPENRSPKISTRPKTAPNLIATVTATTKKSHPRKSNEEHSSKLKKYKISNCGQKLENNIQKKTPSKPSVEKTQAAYERSVKEGRLFFPKDSKDSLGISDNRLTTKIRANSSDNVGKEEKSPGEMSSQHNSDCSPPVRDTNVIKPFVDDVLDKTKMHKTARKPIKVSSRDAKPIVVKSNSTFSQKKISSCLKEGRTKDVINRAYSNEKKQEALLPLTKEQSGPQPEVNSDQQKNYVIDCKPLNIDNYADLTEKCAQRLSDINRGIEEVRKKRSNIYRHLSSDNSSRSESVKSGCSSSFSIDLVKDDFKVPNLTIRHTSNNKRKLPYKNEGTTIPQNIVFPTKASDPLTERSSPNSENFVPILGDIPKPNRVSKSLPTDSVGPKALGSSFLGKLGGKSRPPPALSRIISKINPLVHVEAHELSTVIEVDSPMSVRNSSFNHTRTPLNKSPTIFETPKLGIGSKKKDNLAELFKNVPNYITRVTVEDKPNSCSKIDSEMINITREGNLVTGQKDEVFSYVKNSENFQKVGSKYLDKKPLEKRLEDLKTADTGKSSQLPPKSPKMGRKDQKEPKIVSDSIALSSYKNNDQDKENKFPMIDVETFQEIMLKPFLNFEDYAKKLNLTMTEASLSDTTLSNNSKEKNSNNSEGTLPDIVAELLKRNVISEPFRIEGIPGTINLDSFDGKPTANSTSISPASSVSDLPKKRTNKAKPEKILTKSKTKSSGIRNIDDNVLQDEKSVTADLEGALQDLGLGWMLYTLKKTQESLALSSSSSSSKYGFSHSNMTAAEKLREAKKLLTELPPSSMGSSTDIHSILANILPDTSSIESLEKGKRREGDKKDDKSIKTTERKNNVTQTDQQTSDYGNDSNAIKEFIAKELANKITFSKQSVSQNSDNEHYTSLYSTRNETPNYENADKYNTSDGQSKGSSKTRSHTRRTSTPVQLYKAQAYNNSSSSSLINNSTALFSNVDDMSSVRASRCSVKNDSSSDRDNLLVPSVTLQMKSSQLKDKANSKDSSSDVSSNSLRK